MACSVFRGSRCLSSIFRSSRTVSALETASKTLTLPATTTVSPQYQPHRNSSFRTSPTVRDLNEYPEVEVLRNPPEWKYVERLLPIQTVPLPPTEKNQQFPSGWTVQQKYDPKKDIYFIRRTKNHMLPVYLKQTHRGQRQVTMIRNIIGDIWQLEKDLRRVVEAALGGKISSTQVNEMTGQIHFHGDHVEVLKNHLLTKGF